jgi:hypothetical protein
MTKQHAKNLQDQLSSCGKLPMFEIEVTDTDGNQEFVTCDISINGGQMIAIRDAVSTSELESDKIASNSIDIDECFSLDDHLQSLHESIVCSILGGDLYV